MDKIEKIRSYVRSNGNPTMLRQPIKVTWATPDWDFKLIVGLCNSYDTVLVLTENGGVDLIEELYPHTITQIVKKLKL